MTSVDLPEEDPLNKPRITLNVLQIIAIATAFISMFGAFVYAAYTMEYVTRDLKKLRGDLADFRRYTQEYGLVAREFSRIQSNVKYLTFKVNELEEVSENLLKRGVKEVGSANSINDKEFNVLKNQINELQKKIANGNSSIDSLGHKFIDFENLIKLDTEKALGVPMLNKELEHTKGDMEKELSRLNQRVDVTIYTVAFAMFSLIATIFAQILSNMKVTIARKGRTNNKS